MIKIELNDASVHQALIQAQSRATNLRPLMAGLANKLLEATEDNFANECNPETGQRWPELAPSTRQQRATTGRGGKMLQVSGLLASSIQPNNFGEDYAEVGTNKAYAPVHQFGSGPYTIRPRHKQALAFGGIVRKKVNHPGVPARPFLGLSAQHKADIVEAITNYLPHTEAS